MTGMVFIVDIDSAIKEGSFAPVSSLYYVLSVLVTRGSIPSFALTVVGGRSRKLSIRKIECSRIGVSRICEKLVFFLILIAKR